MLRIEKTVTISPEQWMMVIEGMRNPLNSWDRIDSVVTEENGFRLGDNDRNLMATLANGGPVHAKYRRQIPVWVTINAPLYWWKEFDTYKVGTTSNSCSTMHKIQAKKFTIDDFSHEHLSSLDIGGYLNVSPHLVLQRTINVLNECRQLYLDTKDKDYWWQMIQLLPSSYNQKRTILLNYEVLHNMYMWRKNHKLDEWHTFCHWVESLPHSELITMEDTSAENKTDNKIKEAAKKAYDIIKKVNENYDAYDDNLLAEAIRYLGEVLE